MNLQDRNSRLFNQQVIDSNIDQLIRESPVPQILYGNHLNSGNNNFSVPFLGHGHPVSASAIPIKHGYAASQGARFDPFLSPQNISSSFHSNVANTSVADIFISLKNQSMDDDDKSLESSQWNENTSKENNPVVGNSLNNRHSVSSRQVYQQRNRQQHEERNFNQSCDNSWPAGNRRHGNQQTDKIDWQPHGVVCDSGHDKGPRHQTQKEISGSAVGNNKDNFYEETFQEAFYTDRPDEDDNMSPESTKVCSLYMWIIKPVPGSHDICVEGKKNLRDENFWHSGVITRRVNEKVVETQTKSVYRLEGNMELLDAMAAGFSRKTAEAFWLGFPSDWQQLIYEHFKTAPINSTVETESDSEEEITILEEEECSDDQGQEEITVREIPSTDEGEESAPPLHTDESSDIDLPHSPLDNKKSRSKKGSKVEKVIENWIIRSLPNGKGVHLVGVKADSGNLWHSSAIEKRLDKKRLMSNSGSIYRLKGNMDKLLSLNEGLPVEIIEKFKSGFPKEWQELVQEHLCTKKRSKKKSTISKHKTTHTSKKKGQIGGKKDFKQKQSTQTKSNDKKPVLSSEKKSQVKDVTQGRKSSVSLDNTPVSNREKGVSIPAEPYKRTKTILTPSGESVDLESLGRSRSGRLIKPRLQWWTGQTLELDGENITVKAPTIASSLFLQQFEDGYKKSTHKVKPYWNPRQKDKDYSLNASKSSLNSSVSSVETKTKHHSQRKELVEGTSSKAANNSSQSDEDINQNLKLEVKVILENHRSRRKKVTKRNTCYSNKLIDNEATTDTDNPFDISETTDLETTLTDQEVSDPTKNKRSKRKNDNGPNLVKENRRTIDQVNVVSSSTGDIRTRERNSPGDIGCRKLRSRNVKVPKMDVGVGLKESKKGGVLTNKEKAITDELKDSDFESDKESKRKSEVSKRDINNKGTCFRKRGKTLPVIEEDDQQDTDDPSLEPVSKSGKKKNGIQKHAFSKLSVIESKKKSENVHKAPECSDDNTDHWTKEEKDRLKDACKNVPPNNTHYWEKVSAEVRTKTAEMCKAMYYIDQKPPKSAEKKNKKNVKEKEKVTSLTANVGTLKRKQQLKDLLEQQNDNYTDDIFDSTPFRNSRKRKVLGENDDDAIFEELARKQGKSRFETPVSTETMCRRISVPFASTKKTPVSNINVETLEGSGDTDAYVHKILKRRLLSRGKKKHVTPKSVKKAKVPEISPQQKLMFHNYLGENNKEDSENHEDSSQEEDFYWEDDENTDKSVLKTSDR